MINQKYKNISHIAFILAAGFIAHSPLYAQEETSALVVNLIDRVGAVEADNRELRGKLEESQHEISLLKQKIETLSADVDYRLNNPESGASPTSLSSEPLPLGKDEETSPLPSDGGNEYEKARTLLEQGDYEAAERAFSAFVKNHPKDDQAGIAQYWLGVTYFVRGQHEKASAAFAKGYKNYPKSLKAADMLLKLAKSLAALDQKANACATLEQLSSAHPKSHTKEVVNEKKKLGC